MVIKPIHEGNDCHEPAGSPEGGQFCSKGGTDPADITAEAHRTFYRMASEEYDRRVAWTAQTGGGDPGPAMELPRTFSATAATRYITTYYSGWKKAFASKPALTAALRAANQMVGRGKIKVPYYGPGVAGYGMGLRPLAYDKFSREDVDRWISGLIAGR